MDFNKLYINGAWISAKSKDTISVINPSDESVVGVVPNADSEDVKLAINAAKNAKENWQNTPFRVRIKYLYKAMKELKKMSSELNDIVLSELGSPITWTVKVQVNDSIRIFERFINLAQSYEFEKHFGNYILRKEPIGVVLAITPWNYPIYQVVQKVVPALLCGNTVVLKPSSETPITAHYFVEAFNRVGLPNGVLNLVTGSGDELSSHLIKDENVDMISFTGSTSVGKIISMKAGQSFKRLALELGGKSPCIVLEDGDINIACQKVMNSCFLNSGQTCSALSRILVPKSLKNSVIQNIKDNVSKYKPSILQNPDTLVGTLVSKKQKQKVLGMVNDALKEGATLEAGSINSDDNAIFEPILLCVKKDMFIAKNEVFGPVLCLIEYESLEDAINIANDTRYGLSAAVIGSYERAIEVAKKIKSGQVYINNSPSLFEAPFGGYKESGIGREGGLYGFDEFLETKAILNG